MVNVIRSVLLTNTGLQSLEKIIAMRKIENSKFSKSYLTHKLGLSSRSYLTDVFAGRKKLAAKYVTPIVRLLDLEQEETEYLEKLLLKETDFASNTSSKQGLDDDIKVLEKNLRYQSINMRDASDIFTLSLVYLSFFLYPDCRVLKRNLISLLKDIPSKDIEDSLRLLQKKDLVIQDNGYLQVNPNRDFSFLSADFDADQEVKNLQDTLREAQQKVKLMRCQRDEVIFHSSLLTVKKEEFLKLLPKFKTDLKTMHAELEHESPDTLLRFNIQVYPTLSKINSKRS